MDEGRVPALSRARLGSEDWLGMNEGVVGDHDRDHRRRDPEQPHFICDQLVGSIG
ncbi:MAG: hypothetical protein ACXVH3_38355 [Solirubrobacteraceae bacterium]|jgi:hypothetical protein